MPVHPELDLAALDVGDGLPHAGRDRAGLGVGHEPARAQHPAEPAYLAHQIGGGDDRVEVQEPALDALDEVVGADVVGARRPSLLRPVARGEDEHPGGLAGAVGQVHRAADHLVRLARVHPEPERHLDGGVELGGGGLPGERDRLGRAVEPVPVDLGLRGPERLAALHVLLSLTKWRLWSTGQALALPHPGLTPRTHLQFSLLPL